MTISGATRVAGVIGDPVRHSLSPVLHNAAYLELGLDWVYVAFEVPDGATRAALDAVRALGLAGLSVTMPHKSAAAACCDELSADASALRSVNTVSPGLVATEMIEHVPERVMDKLRAEIPVRRLGRPEEIARVVAFLCADGSAYITGQVWSVNGGMEM